MKIIIVSFFSIFLLLSCGMNPSKEIKTTADSVVSSVGTEKMPKDTAKIKVNVDNAEPSFYSKIDLLKILTYFPELDQENYLSPDEVWNSRGLCGDSTDHGFGGEAGQDQYYVLYGYYLRQRNGDKKYQNERQRVTLLYQKINEIFGILSHGGTYFGHQYQRIEGYAEYSVFLFKNEKRYFEKSYNISKQKGLFIQSLRQVIADEIRADKDITEDQFRTERINQLNKVVDEIDKNITDYFYLEQTQEFRYVHYR